MMLSLSKVVLLLGAGASAAPFSFPLPNGFPNITNTSSTWSQIEIQAHGKPPNRGVSHAIVETTAIVYSVLTFVEYFKLAYISELLTNVTEAVPGYDLGDQTERVTQILTAVQAQEEVHIATTNSLLTNYSAIQPCQYQNFGVDNFDDAMTFASFITDSILGITQLIAVEDGKDGDYELNDLITALAENEGEQNGYYRSLSPDNLLPSALPFLTIDPGIFIYSLINQHYAVPGSCPSRKGIPIPVLPDLNLLTPNPGPNTATLQFSFTNTTNYSSDALSLVYLNQQTLPIVTELKVDSVVGDVVTFTADFPYSENLMNGMTIASITNSSGPFRRAPQVANTAIYGPVFIEIN